MKLRRIMIIAGALLLAGCQTIENPQQAVFAAKALHNTLLTGAVAYVERPSCNRVTPPAPLICAKPDVAVAINKADDAAAKVLDSAETTVRTPGFGDSVYQSAVAAARGAVDALSALLTSTK